MGYIKGKLDHCLLKWTVSQNRTEQKQNKIKWKQNKIKALHFPSLRLFQTKRRGRRRRKRRKKGRGGGEETNEGSSLHHSGMW